MSRVIVTGYGVHHCTLHIFIDLSLRTLKLYKIITSQLKLKTYRLEKFLTVRKTWCSCIELGKIYSQHLLNNLQLYNANSRVSDALFQLQQASFNCVHADKETAILWGSEVLVLNVFFVEFSFMCIHFYWIYVMVIWNKRSGPHFQRTHNFIEKTKIYLKNWR